MKMDSTKNLSILITGADGSIGRTFIADRRNAKKHLMLHIRSEKEDFSKWLEEISKAYDFTYELFYADFSNPDEIKSFSTKILNSEHRISHFLHLVGIPYGSLFMMTSRRNLENVFTINYFSSVQIVQSVIKNMIKYGEGVFIYLSSIAAVEIYPGYTAYGSSKIAFDHSMKILASEIREKAVKICGIASGPIESEMAKKMDQKILNAIVADSPTKRLSQPKDVTNVVFTIFDGKISYDSGDIIRFEGGQISD